MKAEIKNEIKCIVIEDKYEEIVGENSIGLTYDYKKRDIDYFDSQEPHE